MLSSRVFPLSSQSGYNTRFSRMGLVFSKKNISKISKSALFNISCDKKISSEYLGIRRKHNIEVKTVRNISKAKLKSYETQDDENQLKLLQKSISDALGGKTKRHPINGLSLFKEQLTNKTIRNVLQSPLKSKLLIYREFPLLNSARTFSTSTHLDLRTQQFPAVEVTNNKSFHKKLHENPRGTLTDYYIILSNALEEDIKVETNYSQYKNSKWACTVTVKWPEEKSFTRISSSKKSAAAQCAQEVLNWLNDLKKIDAYGKPLLEGQDQKGNFSKSVRVLNLRPLVMENLNKISDIYEMKFVKVLADNLEDRIELKKDEENVADDVEGLWPANRVNKQINRNMEFYEVKEKIKLPISEFKEKIINDIRNNKIVIIKGEPGCGKSTRVPQYILEDWAKNNTEGQDVCRIVVTQPRRIAAISLAQRVADEREESVAETVGYQVRLQSNFSPHMGKIFYCTNGILLRRIQSDPYLTDCSHIILDEAHERDVNTDLLMNLLKYALNKNEKLKLIVMSATIDAEVFQKYFDGAPICYIPGFTYPVKQHFLESSFRLNNTAEMIKKDTTTVVHEDVAAIIKSIHKTKPEGAILCFLPGWDEINNVKYLLPNSGDLQVFCLHSRLHLNEQRKIFSKAPPGIRKIILATNIAETSVTIDDVVYVIDTGIHKVKSFDAEKGVSCLDNSWISKANAMQRKGRAGRCQPGESFHLYTTDKLDQLEEYPLPEILRSPLTKIVLDGKVYSNNMKASKFLGQLITPPSDEALGRAVSELTELELLDDSENLTPLGKTLANFPLEPKLAKALVNAIIFKCTTPMVDIVTLFAEEVQIFSSSLDAKQNIREAKAEFSKGSDHLALMKMFERWLQFSNGPNRESSQMFCYQNNLIEPKLVTLQKLRNIHFDYLEKHLKSVLPMSDDYSDNDELVKAVLLSGVGTILEHFHHQRTSASGKLKSSVLTRNNHKAIISTESVNTKRKQYPSDYLLYINEVISNIRRSCLIRETSLISLLSVLLFKNNKVVLKNLPVHKYSNDLESAEQVLLTMENTKLKYICDKGQAEAIIKCKMALNSMVQYYIFQLTKGGEYNPDVNKEWNSILEILNTTLLEEDTEKF